LLLVKKNVFLRKEKILINSMDNRITRLLKKYFSTAFYFYKYLRHRIFLMLTLIVLIGLLDSFGLTMFLPLLQMANNEVMVNNQDLGNMNFVLKTFNFLGIELNLKNSLLLLFVFFLIKGGFVYVATVYKVKTNQFFASNLRTNLITAFTSYSFKSFVVSDIGRIQNSFTGEISRVTGAFSNYLECIQQIIMIVVYLGFVFLVDWKFALLVCAGGIISNFFFRSLFKKTKQQSTHLTKNNNYFQGLITQFISNFKYLKATGFLTNYADKMLFGIKQIETNNTQIGMLNAQIIALREPFMIGIVCLVILVQVNYFDGNLGAILVSLLFFYRALTALLAFQGKYNNFLSASGSLENILNFEDELKFNKDKNGDVLFTQFQNVISLKNVTFSYNAPDPILRKINLQIINKQTIAFAGESGSGKTTLVNLICGLFKPDEGVLLIDEVDINLLNLKSFQSRIGYISQDPVIFSDTFFNNITFWAPPTKENKLKFSAAVEKAAISKFINTLEKKEETLLGNNGINLSGGQKQRVSIARELFKEIDILILDEATSALDSETEREIQENIDLLKGNYTILIIAHRLATIKNADRIFLMDKGEIVDEGSFEKLFISSKRFKRMVQLQEI
jgi:ABC-type multidrug transport system fused ATPase/permease subunit